MMCSIPARTAIFGESKVFGAIERSTLRVLAEMVREDAFLAGTTVCLEGEHAQELFIVASGSLAVSRGGVEVRTLARGDVLGEYGMFGDQRRTASVTARADTVLLVLDYQRFRDLLLSYPDACLSLLALTVARLVSNERNRP